jgi:hypothetical protein
VKKILQAVSLLALLCFSADAFAQDSIPSPSVRPGFKGSVSRELATFTRTVVMDVPSLTAATDVTPGVDGVLTATTVNNNATPERYGASQIFPPPYPCKLDVKVHDDSSGDTLVCASVTLKGIDQFGKANNEVLYPSGETTIESKKVYARLDSVVGAGCTANAGDDGDVLRVACSAEIGIPMKITNAKSIMSFAIWDASASELFNFKPSDLTIDLQAMSIETDNLTPTIAPGDIVFFTGVADGK